CLIVERAGCFAADRQRSQSAATHRGRRAALVVVPGSVAAKIIGVVDGAVAIVIDAVCTRGTVWTIGAVVLFAILQDDRATWIVGKIDQSVAIVVDTIATRGNRLVRFIVIVAVVATRIFEVDESITIVV